MVLIKVFLNRLGEAARIRVGIFRYLRNIRILQRCCRIFIADKKARLAKMNAQWTRVEDAYLSQYFKTYAAKIMAEEAARRERDARSHGYNPKSQKLDKGHLAPGEMAGAADRVNSFNWRKLRVPANIRLKALSRHYMTHAWQFTKNSAAWLKLMTQNIKAQVEMSRFLKSLGAGDDQVSHEELNKATPNPEQPSREFWALSDEGMVILIMETAYTLKHQEPFQIHPAAKELKDSDMQKEKKATKNRRTQQQSNKRGSHWAKFSLGLGFKKRRPDHEEEPKNIDEVLSRFGPRFDDGPIDEGPPQHNNIHNIDEALSQHT